MLRREKDEKRKRRGKAYAFASGYTVIFWQSQKWERRARESYTIKIKPAER